MLNFTSLYSGSTGNSLLVQTQNTNILIDTGVSAKKIIDALTSFNTSIDKIDAVIVTHEHIDHVNSLGTISSKYNIPVYANKKTWNNMPKQKDRISEKNQKIFHIGEVFEINDLKINSFSIPHDAADPCGFNIYKDNKKISIATDIGHMTNEILSKLEGSNFLMLEANYDPEILKCCSYPYKLKTRISGPNGHLSNEMAGKTISYLSKSGLNNVILGHLSKENNFPELAYKTVIDELISSNFNENNFSLNVASREKPGSTIEI